MGNNNRKFNNKFNSDEEPRNKKPRKGSGFSMPQKPEREAFLQTFPMYTLDIHMNSAGHTNIDFHHGIDPKVKCVEWAPITVDADGQSQMHKKVGYTPENLFECISDLTVDERGRVLTGTVWNGPWSEEGAEVDTTLPRVVNIINPSDLKRADLSAEHNWRLRAMIVARSKLPIQLRWQSRERAVADAVRRQMMNKWFNEKRQPISSCSLVLASMIQEANNAFAREGEGRFSTDEHYQTRGLHLNGLTYFGAASEDNKERAGTARGQLMFSHLLLIWDPLPGQRANRRSVDILTGAFCARGFTFKDDPPVSQPINHTTAITIDWSAEQLVVGKNDELFKNAISEECVKMEAAATATVAAARAQAQRLGIKKVVIS